jgi:hypothetical protein
MEKSGGHLGEAFSRRFLALGAVLAAVSAAIVVVISGNAGLARGEVRADEPLSWEAALDNVEPAEPYEPIPGNLQDFPWTWQERASQAASEMRNSYPDDFSWFEFVSEGLGARIGFAGGVPDGASEIIDSLRSGGETVEVFDEQTLDEQEIFAANNYLAAGAQDESADLTSVLIELGDSPAIRVAGVSKSEASAVAASLARHVADVAQKTGYPALTEFPVKFEAPLDHEPTDPVYDEMILGP